MNPAVLTAFALVIVAGLQGPVIRESPVMSRRSPKAGKLRRGSINA